MVFTEGPIEPNLAAGTGYAESKWVSEQILYTAASKTSLNALVVRVGQVCGGLDGAWNVHEWFPTLVQSALRLGCFPDDDKVRSSCLTSQPNILDWTTQFPRV